MHDEVFVTRAEIAVGNLRILSGKEAATFSRNMVFRRRGKAGVML
jgi:hypothetical protein